MRFFLILLGLLFARSIAAQNIGAPATGRGTRVSGVVYDSVAGRVLQGAMVQLVSADNQSHFGKTVSADALGRFSFDSVPDGNYNIGFFHPVLDSLGLEPPVHALRVAGQVTLQADVAVPSPERIRAAICGPHTVPNTAALVTGIVRDARDGSPINGAKVVASWLELTFTGGAIAKNTPRRFTATKENGWFGICNVPSPGAVELIAGLGADSTDYIEVQVPASGFFRRDMYVGAARVVPVADSVRKADSLARNPKRLFAGDGFLTGTVIASDSKLPVSNARVSIVDGPQTITNERGEWTLRNIASGTRTLDVRALGHYPDHRAIDVINDAPTVRVELTTLKAVLAEVKITATRLGSRNYVEFEERRKSAGMGRFLTAADIAKRNPFSASEIFRNFPGVYYEGRDTTIVQMRGVFADRCSPAIFVNGHMVQGGSSENATVSGMSAADIDMFVKPSEIVGVEVYQTGQVPGQFLVPLSGCGSIVFWTK
ncbi:MAG: carboxypeptidase regulatory-like domain-containing protein [Gemmatimonadaceae bacterium]